MASKQEQHQIRWLLVLYDFFIFVAYAVAIYGIYRGTARPTPGVAVYHTVLTGICVFGCRFAGNIYTQIWRYGGIQCYIRLLLTDALAFVLNLILNYALPFYHIGFSRLLGMICLYCLTSLAIRMLYRYGYKTGRMGKLLYLISLGRVSVAERTGIRKVKIAIVGAGRVGVSLAEDLMNNNAAAYEPVCFVETDPEKVGRKIHNLPVVGEKTLKNMELVQEVVFAVPQLDKNQKKALYERYTADGFKVKIYDFPTMQAPGGKRSMREFDVEDLLFRKQIIVTNEKTEAYYQGKSVLITGGGGSIGSELCRQLAKMGPSRIIILDIYENGAYDVQQELRMAYKGKLDVQVVIASVTNKKALERAFRKYRPQVVINAAAHKHVPFMETDCIEAVENNVFGTLNTVETAEKYGVDKFIMVSTDKAVNPTNAMGATKRMCEMIVLNHRGNMKCSATRFGNVLGSAGSVIPLFRRQIAAGGPVTITDKRIIRYFMTIPEASQLVLQSGAMANHGELFVLDMGEPVRILDLAENMIRMSGQTGIDIVETGLRPGEKLYEELLVKTEELDKTENDLIFIERDKKLEPAEVSEKLDILHAAVETDEDEKVRTALMEVVPTYVRPETVNSKVRA